MIVRDNIGFDSWAYKEALYSYSLDKIQYADDMYSAAKGADVLVILTEWPEFSTIDLDVLDQLMNNKIILDYRNMLDKKAVLAKGFKYKCIGK